MMDLSIGSFGTINNDIDQAEIMIAEFENEVNQAISGLVKQNEELENYAGSCLTPYEQNDFTINMGEIIFEYTTGGDGYGFSGSIKDLDKLLDDLKKLIQYGTIHDE